jgi:FecR protein
MFRGLTSWAVLAALAIAPICAQDPNAPPPQAGPDPNGQYEPGRAVARLSVASGDVSVRRGDSGELVAAAVNAPLMADDHVLTSANSRAEIEFDSSNVIRVGPNSDVHLAALDIHSVQIQVAAGTVMFRTLRPGQVQVEVDTPSVAVRPLQPGAYRVTLREDGASQMPISEITVRAGEAEIDSQRGGDKLEAGQTMQARGPASDPEYQLVQGIPQDSFDRWNEERDRYFQASQSYEHVNPAVAGGEDLDQNGRWVNDPQYGQVWQPNVQPGWAPYQNGQWVWEDYYGWTWVSYDPWGWAPYHYGRWFWGAGGWDWWPGPVGPYPYWAPAYVGFFGFGPGIGLGVGFGFGGVGWVALAPFEIFHPWWGPGFYGGFGGGFYGGHTTLVNNINVYDSFRNARVAGGAIGMNTAGFGRGGRVTALNRTQLTSASAVHGVLPVAPDRSSLRFSSRAVSGRYPQTRSQSFASRMQAPRVQHTSFEQQQRGMQQLSRGNFSRGSLAGSSNATHGWSRFGEPIHGTSSSGSAYGTYGRSGSTSQFGRSYGSAARGYSGSAVRINPSIVQRQQGGQSRPAPNAARPSGGHFGGGGGRSSGGGGHR